MVEFQENIICRTIFHKIPDQISKNNMGEVKIEFQENNIQGRIFVQKLSSRKKFLTKTSANNMREVKFEFQENNNGLLFSRRPSLLMGIFFYECRFQMTDSLSFRNESHRFILD